MYFQVWPAAVVVRKERDRGAAIPAEPSDEDERVIRGRNKDGKPGIEITTSNAKNPRVPEAMVERASP
jgi:hypothetical protein